MKRTFLKMLHTADLHFTNSSLLRDEVKCTNFLLEIAASEKPDLIFIAGDIFDERVSLGSPASLSAINFVFRLGHIAPVVIVKGTPAHDVGNSLQVFSKLKTLYPIYVSENIEQVCFDGKSFIPANESNIEECIAVISCLPSVQKGSILSLREGNDENIEDGNIEIANLLRDVFIGWGVLNRKAADLKIPTILVGHGSVLGASLSTGQKMVGRDIEFGIGDIRLAGCNLVCLGHIHKMQYWGEVFYSGSITRMNRSEEEDKGFFIHEIGRNVSSKFIKTPSRIMKTIECENLPTPDIITDVEGTILTIRYSVPEEDVHKVDENELKRIAKEKGAEDVKIEKTIIPKVRVRAEGISREKNLAKKLERWAETVGQGLPPGVFDKLSLLEEDIEVEKEENETPLFTT